MPLFIVVWIQALFALVRAFFLNFFTRFWAFIIFLAPVLIKKIMVLLGIGFASYAGFDAIMTKLQSFVFQRFNGLPSDLLQILLLAKFDVGLNIILTSMTIGISIRVMTKSASLIRTTPSETPS